MECEKRETLAGVSLTVCFAAALLRPWFQSDADGFIFEAHCESWVSTPVLRHYDRAMDRDIAEH